MILFGLEHATANVIIAIITAGLAFLTAILVPIIQWYLKNKEHGRDLVKDALEEQIRITNKLQVLLEETNSDRVSIFQFHNGEQFFSSPTHIKKISKAFEVCAVGIAQDFGQMQGLPIHQFIKEIKEVYDIGFICNADLNKGQVDPFTGFMKAKGIQSWYAFAIRSLNKSKLIGILTVVYIKQPHEMTTEETINCKLTSERLSGYISK